ncbi:MAG TPA: NUDIX hydrolase [Pseudolabrys sp.]|jgi:8-oxo-dGTP pyrophosphatase MutT (NUDIX family)|nr:NUDIX hydrolase [Pseudolabrys sp.]
MNDKEFGQRLTDRMTKSERDQSFPDSVPRDAATLMLIDRTGAEPTVLMGRRHANHKFMPGKFVFPGGRIEVGDATMGAASELAAAAESKVALRPRDGDVPPARAFPLCAVRETFEETGLMLGVKSGSGKVAAAPPNPDWEAFAAAGVLPDLANIHFIARAVTPPRRPKRFDTRFFTADAQMVAHKVDGVVGPDSELVELVWIPIKDAKTLDLPTITATILEELEARVKAGMGHDLPVPFYFMENQQFFRDLL